jgi:CYTH domain-containing protein
METKLEKERRFLIKHLPFVKGGYDKCLGIRQFYKGKARYRVVECDDTGETFYITFKKNLEPGVCEETEKEITRDEFVKAIGEAGSSIRKTRYVKFNGDQTWEIDIFDFQLAIAEIELDDIDEDIEIPQFIKDVVIMEVTGMPEFSNRNLSSPR